MAIKTPKYVILNADKKPSFIRAHWLLVSLLGLAVVTFLLGRYSHLGVLQAFKGQKTTWVEVNQQLTEQNEANQKTISQLQTAVKIKEQAILELQQNMNSISDDNAALKAELSFYENLLSHKDEIKKLRVFEVTAEPLAELYQLKVVLAQKLQRANVVKGQLALKLKGIKDDAGQTIDLVEQFDLENDFEFKYFQIKKYAFSLPKGFNPTMLLVELKSNKKVISEEFQWSEIAGGSAQELNDDIIVTQN
ncbi:hypothetical protein OS175_00820 [Marinicella sp. S1101]|uniref:DUF6776 family protein n=1 Tax=Marinicella marina TaxID=2996016 RepID=UPI0022609C1A|nr:DUF6776 family protein [Marinicella marina]MCX7552405.1 hypothetical protein [Marinicella marina]MDJ1139280.1 hypothetical protein [Marinicella marina]